MELYKNILFCLILTGSIICTANSREWRPSQIPNGNVNMCANCHINPSGGGPRNDFGKTVESKFLSSGNVVWNAELASIDSDNDGFPNGEELQDPTGSWKTGEPQPGNSELVSNPGNAASIPPRQVLFTMRVTLR